MMAKFEKETDGMLIAVQDLALRTRYIRKFIDNEDVTSACRMCGKMDDIVAHIVSECSVLWCRSTTKLGHMIE